MELSTWHGESRRAWTLIALCPECRSFSTLITISLKRLRSTGQLAAYGREKCEVDSEAPILALFSFVFTLRTPASPSPCSNLLTTSFASRFRHSTGYWVVPKVYKLMHTTKPWHYQLIVPH